MKEDKINQAKLEKEKNDPLKTNDTDKKNKDEKWNKVKSVNLKGKKVDADPDNEADKPVDVLNEPGK